jgi:nucleobase:cation symporter-1, NCS1 family
MDQGIVELRTNPVSDRAWSIETNGTNHIPDEERHGQPRELFWIWAGANIGILGVTYGAFLVVFYSLNLVQGIIAAVLGAVIGFVLVGVVGLAGKRAGAPTLVISRAAFGVDGNYLPAAISYLSFIGWEIVVTTLAVLATETVLHRLGLNGGNATIAVSFVIIAAVGVTVSLLGHATILIMQKAFTYAFGVLTIVFIVLEWGQIDWHKVSNLPSGTFAGLIGGISIIMAGLGIGYVNGGADYTRYLPKNSSGRAIVGWTTLGASLPQVILMIFGIFLTASNASLATTSNPIGALAKPLPTWFLVPYMIAAAGGLIAATLVNMYSSGLSLMALGVRLPRYKTVLVDAALMTVGCIYLLFFATNFFGPLEGFLVTLGVPLAAWAAIFITDLFLFHRKSYVERDFYRRDGVYGAWGIPALTALIVATVIGLGLVNSTASGFSWVGYFLGAFGGKTGAIGSSSIGIIISFVIGFLIYGGLALGRVRAGNLAGNIAAQPAEKPTMAHD